MYTYKTFHATTLPTALPEADVGTGPVRSDAILLPSGTIWDPRGTSTTGRNKKLIYTMEYGCLIKAASAAAAHTAYQVLRAQVGQYAKLYRELHDASTQWMNCRLLEITSTRTPGMNSYLPISMVFETREQVWSGAAVQKIQAFSVAPSGQVALANAGDATATDITITITASTSAITRVDFLETTMSNWYKNFRYDGSIAATKSLVIDCGAWSVQNDGSDDWDNFSFLSNHDVPEIFTVPGIGATIVATKTGGDGDSAMQYDYYNTYA